MKIFLVTFTIIICVALVGWLLYRNVGKVSTEQQNNSEELPHSVNEVVTSKQEQKPLIETGNISKSLSDNKTDSISKKSSKESINEQEPSLETVITVIEDSQRYYDQLIKKDPEVLWNQWYRLLAGDNNRTRNIIRRALITQLQHKGSKDVYQDLSSLLRESSLPITQNKLIINLLGETATPEAMTILLDEAMSNQDTPLRPTILEKITEMGDEWWDNRSHPELSPPLEKAWNSELNDQNLINAIAIGMAKVGSPSGVKLLLTAIAKGGNTVDEINKGQNQQALAAFEAMDGILNNAAAPTLAEEFHNRELNDPVFIASGNALANIANIEATKALIEWVKNAPDEAVPLVEQWFMEASRNTESFDLLQQSLQSESFQSVKIKKEIQAVIKSREPLESQE